MNLLYTCLAAPESLVAAGFSTVVALESDRIPLAAFKDGAEASAWCNAKNGKNEPTVAKNEPTVAKNEPTLAQKVAAVVGKT